VARKEHLRGLKAMRFAAVWKRHPFRQRKSAGSRKYPAKHILSPEDVVDTAPMVRYFVAVS
jgi:hypothetical protein